MNNKNIFLPASVLVFSSEWTVKSGVPGEITPFNVISSFKGQKKYIMLIKLA